MNKVKITHCKVVIQRIKTTLTIITIEAKYKCEKNLILQISLNIILKNIHGCAFPYIQWELIPKTTTIAHDTLLTSC